jgi:hypothetical protein
MVSGLRRLRPSLLLIGVCLVLPAVVLVAQQGPVAAMFGDDQKRGESIALSFATAELPATAAAPLALQIYLTGGDLERAFDTVRFRPDAAIIPTNTDLEITAALPGTQQVLVERVRRQQAVFKDMQGQIALRRKQPSTGPAGQEGLLDIGEDWLLVQLPRSTTGKPANGAFPRLACLIPTEFPKGGAIDRRELFTQDRVRKGIAGCLAAFDAAGAQSVVLPLMGAASARTQANDPVFEGQRVLKECRQLNSLAGIALGIHDFAPSRRNLREIGIIHYDQEIIEMFSLPKGTRLAQTAQNAYRTFSDQIKLALRKGLAGEKTTSTDIEGGCASILNVQ